MTTKKLSKSFTYSQNQLLGQSSHISGLLYFSKKLFKKRRVSDLNDRIHHCEAFLRNFVSDCRSSPEDRRKLTNNDSGAFQRISEKLIDIHRAFYNRSYDLKSAERWENLRDQGYRPVKRSNLDQVWWSQERRNGRIQPDHELSRPIIELRRIQMIPKSDSQSTTPFKKTQSNRSFTTKASRLLREDRDSQSYKSDLSSKKLFKRKNLLPRLLHKDSPEIIDLVGDASDFGVPDLSGTSVDSESDTHATILGQLGSSPGSKGIKGLRPGSFLELRRTNQSEAGILVRVQGNEVIYIGRSGEVRVSILDNVMYMMHGFVAEDIALKTFDDDFAVEGLNDSTVDNSSNSYTQKEILEKTETILDARKVCCRALRSLEKQLDKRHSVLTKAGSYALYHHFRNRDRRKASQLTSERGVKFLLGSEYARDELIVFALHQQLMSSPDMFLANSREMRDESNFSVQPLDSLIALKTVRSWISQDSVEMRSFVSKCQAIVLARRHHEASKSLSSFSSSSSSALHFSSKKFPPWTESDLIFIRVFRNIAVNQRMIQDQPYSTVVASILKKIGLYDERAMDENWPSLTFDRFGAIALLKDLGILPTWQTVGIWDPDLNIENRIFEKLRTSSVKESSRAIEPSPASTDSQSLKSNKKPGVGSKGENKLISDLCDELRHDFGNLAVYIIDDLEAQELDDGISIEMIDQVSTIDEKGPGMLQAWIHIHVADPSAHLDPSDSVSLRARTYLESVYLPGFSLPMIPSDFIGSNRMSLGSSGSVEGSFSVTTGQRTLTFSAKVDESGNLLEYKVRPGLIRNSKLITYQTVAEILDGTPSAPSPQVFIGSRLETASSDQQKALGRLSSKDLDETDLYKIKQLGRFSKCLTGRRVDDGAISWQLPIAHASIPSNNPHLWPSVEISRTPRLLVGNPTVSVTFPSKIEDLKTHGWGITSSQGLVTEMMLLAGRIAGRFYADRRLAGDKILLPFRSQPSPEKIGSIQNQATLRELKRRVNPQTGLISPFDFQKSRIIFMPAVNGLEPMTHFPLGIDDGYGYCRVTSPLRRYGDLLAHWQIKNSILRWAGKRTYEDSQKVLSEKMMVEFIGRLDRESKPVVNLCRKSNLSWITYVLRRLIKSSKEDGRDDDLRSFGIDEIEEMIERRLTAVIFQDPVLMRYTNRWSIKTYVPELGLKASLLVDGIEDWFSGWSVGDRIRDDVYPGDFHDVLKKGSCVITPFESDDPVGLRLPVKIKFINEDDHIILKFDRDRIDTIQQTVS